MFGSSTPSDPVTLRLEDITVTVTEPGGGITPILSLAALDLPPGQSLGIAGPSGAGKSTLLKVIAGLIAPATGRVLCNGAALPLGRRRDHWRRHTLGLVFQDFALLPELSARDNVLLPLDFDHWRRPRDLVERADALLARMGLSAPHRRAGHLSRGEQQRVAVARALLRRPALLLADEPTASLDDANGDAIAGLLLDSARDSGAALVVVSHDQRLLARCQRVLRLERGHPVEGAT